MSEIFVDKSRLMAAINRIKAIRAIRSFMRPSEFGCEICNPCSPRRGIIEENTDF
jgi:sulfur relay (sulfurtransferase) complex TusBCD TusD component (DsrE family)